jgi:hypothetical protein
MNMNEILTRLEYGNGEFELEVFCEAIRRSAEIAPAMLQILENIAADYELPLPEQYTGHFYAIHILTELCETEAHIPLLQLCLLPERRLNALFGNILDGEMDRALAATCGGDFSGITLLIEDEEACEDARVIGVRALVQLASSDGVSRKDIVGTLEDLLDSPEMPMLLWEELVFCAELLAATEPKPDVRPACVAPVGDPEWWNRYRAA